MEYTLYTYEAITSQSRFLRKPINCTEDNVAMTIHSTCLIYFLGFNAGANEDLAFMETAAHEFGHDVLMASGGFIWSWGHEGTSTIFGNTVSSTPAHPPNPQPINLMWYQVGGDLTNYYNRYAKFL